MPVSLIIFWRVNIYLQNISIKRRLSRFHRKTCTACLSALLNVHVPISKLHAQMSLIFTLRYEFELSTLPSIPSNGHGGGLCFLQFYYNLGKLLSCFYFQQNQLKFVYYLVQIFHFPPCGPVQKFYCTSKCFVGLLQARKPNSSA